MADKNKYPGYNENDTQFDEKHRSQGIMTNREFFTSNAPGGFYNGMEWDESSQEWVPNEAERERQGELQRQQDDARRCSECGTLGHCWCEMS